MERLTPGLPNSSKRQTTVCQRGPKIMAEHNSPQCLNVRNDSVVAAARESLGRHAHFRGRLGLFVFEVQAGVLIIHGSVPSYYLKQVLQTALHELRGVTRIVNRVDVVCPGGVSSCSKQTASDAPWSTRGCGNCPHASPPAI